MAIVFVFIRIHVVDLRIMLKGKEHEANPTVMEGGPNQLHTVSKLPAGMEGTFSTSLGWGLWPLFFPRLNSPEEYLTKTLGCQGSTLCEAQGEGDSHCQVLMTRIQRVR